MIWFWCIIEFRLGAYVSYVVSMLGKIFEVIPYCQKESIFVL